jgi:hypothetical protein
VSALPARGLNEKLGIDHHRKLLQRPSIDSVCRQVVSTERVGLR